MSIGVKICGLNNRSSVEAAVRGGARWAGFVFYPPSPRAISVDDAQMLSEITAGSGTERVGVFVDPNDALLDEIVPHIDRIQLHGTETPERVAEIRNRYEKPLIKAFRIKSEEDFAPINGFNEVADMFLFDAKPSKDALLPGGNGEPFEWSLLKGRGFVRPWILSGGLDAENLRSALDISGAEAVDVSSGVEIEPGVKSLDKIAAFLRCARSYIPKEQ